MLNLDHFLFKEINQFAGIWSSLDLIFIFFAKYFGYILIFFLILLLIKSFKKYFPMVFQAFLAGILARGVIVNIIHWL